MAATRQILLVEDNALDAELVFEALTEANLINSTFRVPDGAEALDYLYRRGVFAGRTDPQPSVILLDLKTPKLDGLEVLRRVKADAGLRTIPVVVFTSSREPDDLARSYDLGANSFLVKPVGYDEFIACVKALGVQWMQLNQPPPMAGRLLPCGAGPG